MYIRMKSSLIPRFLGFLVIVCKKSGRAWETHVKSHTTSLCLHCTCNLVAGMYGIYATCMGWHLIHVRDFISHAIPLFTCNDKEIEKPESEDDHGNCITYMYIINDRVTCTCTNLLLTLCWKKLGSRYLSNRCENGIRDSLQFT